MLNLIPVQTLMVCELIIFLLPRSKKLHVVSLSLSSTHSVRATCQKENNLGEKKLTK